MKQLLFFTILVFSLFALIQGRMKQSPNFGYGKPSAVNGLPKNKIISPHVKRTCRGYVSVNSYARSR